jgi:putative redox protein
MSEIIETTWKGNMAFEASIDGFSVKMDAHPNFGGSGFGPRPKPFVLSALAGCTAMDVISILGKKKLIPAEFRVLVDGTLTEQHPKYYKTIVVTYEFKGENWENNPDVQAAVQRAVQLSAENYCGVNAMLKGSCDISHEIRLLNL